MMRAVGDRLEAELISARCFLSCLFSTTCFGCVQACSFGLYPVHKASFMA